jgi:hypothetical protein
MLDTEHQGLKRSPVLIVLRELYKSLATGESQPLNLTPEQVERKAFHSEMRTRHNFGRRVYRQDGVFALAEIRLKYPDYTETMLQTDLKTKQQKKRPKKTQTCFGLQRSRLIKLAHRLQAGNLNEA